MTSAQTTVVHTIALLDQPLLGGRALDTVESGARVEPLERAQGFLRVQRNRATGFIPAAACTPLAEDGTQVTGVIQPVAFYRAPVPGQQFEPDLARLQQWTMIPSETLTVCEAQGKYLLIQRTSGQTGYVRAADCDVNETGQAHVKKPVSLQLLPPGAQAAHLVLPGEQMLRLGRDGNFLLVQREQGQLGYVPAVLCGEPPSSDTIIKVGPLDLGWVLLGGGWALINWLSVASILGSSLLLDDALRPVVGIALVLVVAALLWLVSRRQPMARSVALGALLCYALLHVLSNGQLTLWK